MSTYTGDRNVRRIWEDKRDFVKFAAKAPVLGQECPIRTELVMVGVRKQEELPASTAIS